MSLFRRKRSAGPPSDPEGEGTAGAVESGGGAVPEAAGNGAGRRRYIVISAGMMGFVGGGILLLSVFSFWWTSQPSFCDRCHVMNKYVAAWERSPHKDVNCETCHTAPGFFGFVGGKIAGLQVVANFVRGDFTDDSFNAAVPNASCLRCHEDILEGTYTSEETGVTVSHLHIVDNGGKCMNCHSTVAHLDTVPIGSATFPTMDTCMRCHNGDVAPTDCDICHREGPPGPVPPTEVDEETAAGSG
jgi:cytochrome c nitrite reductase small subunit